MKENIRKIVINRPIGEVFEFSTNPKNTGKWFDGIAEERTNEWPPRLGTIYENRSGGGGNQVLAIGTDTVCQITSRAGCSS